MPTFMFSHTEVGGSPRHGNAFGEGEKFLYRVSTAAFALLGCADAYDVVLTASPRVELKCSGFG